MNTVPTTPVKSLCEFEINDKNIHDNLDDTNDFLTTTSTSSENAFVGETFDVDVVQDVDLLFSAVTRPTTGGKQPRKRYHPLKAPQKKPRRNVPAQQLNTVPNIDCQRCIDLQQQVEDLKKKLEQYANSKSK